MSREPEKRGVCLCGAPMHLMNRYVRWLHDDERLDDNHRATPATGTYMDSPGMRNAHLRSMGRG